jgi:hypothetical protein
VLLITLLATALLPALLASCDEVLMPRTRHPAKASGPAPSGPKDCGRDPCAAVTCPPPGACYFDWDCNPACTTGDGEPPNERPR